MLSSKQILILIGLSFACSAKPVLSVFPYDVNSIYTVHLKEGLITDISFNSGEYIEGIYLSDSARWINKVSSTREDLFIKPTESGLYNSGVIITNIHKYQLILTSKAEANWDQRISWKDNNKSNYISEFKTKVGYINPGQIHTQYLAYGNQDFRPKKIFDDGRRTWIYFKPGYRYLPAVFSVYKSLLRAINYKTYPDHILIPEVINHILLKIGSNEVHVYRKQ